MTNQPMDYDGSQDAVHQFSEELLDALLREDDLYPWNPAEEEADAYFTELEQQYSLTDCLDSDEIEARAEQLFAQLNLSWESEDDSQAQSP